MWAKPFRELVPAVIERTTEEEVLGHIEEVFEWYRLPHEILADNGAVFQSRAFAELVQQVGDQTVIQRCATVRRETGIIKWHHGTLKKMWKRGNRPIRDVVRTVQPDTTSRDDYSCLPAEVMFAQQEARKSLHQKKLRRKYGTECVQQEIEGSTRSTQVGDTVVFEASSPENIARDGTGAYVRGLNSKWSVDVDWHASSHRGHSKLSCRQGDNSTTKKSREVSVLEAA